MTIHPLVLTFGIGVGALWLLGEDPADLPRDIAAAVQDFVGRGARLSTSTLDGNGVVVETPDALVAQAAAALGRSVDADAYALARAVRSEEGPADTLTKVRLASVLMNQAADAGLSPLGLTLLHKTDFRSGRFGKQLSGRVSTSQDPYESDLAAAEQALSLGDVTRGAREFVDKVAFGVQAQTSSFADFLASRAATEVGGTFADSPKRIVFFWPASIGLPDGVEGVA